MPKLNKNMIGIIAIVIIVAVFFMQPKEYKKEAGPGNVVITRSITPSTVSAGGTFTVKYTFTGGSGDYGGIIYETIPAGWTIDQLSFLNNLDVFGKKVTGQLIEMPVAGSLSGQYCQYNIYGGSSATLNNGYIEWAADAGTDVLSNQNIYICTDSDGDGYGSGSDRAGCTHSELDCNDGTTAANPGETEVCDSLDNDCDSSINEGMINTGALNALQAGVCAGSKKSCDSGVTAWYNDYSNIATYVATETANTVGTQCDGLDNDCDGTADEPRVHDSDTDCSSVVDNSELLSYITSWISSTVSNANLLDAITAWINS